MLNFRKRGCSSRSWERQNTPGGTFWPTLFPTSTCPMSRELFSWWKTLDLPGKQKRGPKRLRVSVGTAERESLLPSTCAEQQSLITFTFFCKHRNKEIGLQMMDVSLVVSAPYWVSTETTRCRCSSPYRCPSYRQTQFTWVFYPVLGENVKE